MVTGNVTCTTVRDLLPDQNYLFAIAGLVENQTNPAWEDVDLYGRRKPLHGALEGPHATISARSLAFDVRFERFDANSTLRHGLADDRTSTGPRGVDSGEGHYGLVLVGDANVENCNSSSFCCDDFDRETNRCNSPDSYVCRGGMGDDFDNGPSNSLPGEVKMVMRFGQIVAPAEVTSQCGPALRLTGSNPNLSGAAWYPRQLEVAEGFDTYFSFRISNPSSR